MKARALFFDDPEQNVLELICHAGSTADYAAMPGHVTSED
jgi:hypothetical protein